MSKKAVSRKLFAVVVVCVVVIAALVSYYYFVMLPSIGPAIEEVPVGQVVSLTGIAAGFGQGYYWGASKAVGDINALGGVKIGDRRIPAKLITYDDQSDPTRTASLATQLILVDNVVALLGSGPPTFNNPISVVADRYNTPHICAGPFEPWWAGGPYNYSWNIGFRIGAPIPSGDPRAGKPGYTILDVIFAFTDKFANQTNRKVAVLACDDADGRGWYTIFGPALAARGYEPYRIDENFGLYPPGTTDFASMILAWKEAGCEILWGNLPGAEFAILWKQAASLGWRPKLGYPARGALFYEDIMSYGGDLPLGIVAETWWTRVHPYPGIGNRTSASLVDEWFEEKGTPVNPIAGFGGYPYAQLLFDAIERAGSLDKDLINNAIAESDTTILTGTAKFTDTHDSPVPLTIKQWIKTDKPWIWQDYVVYSDHPEIPVEHEPIFPLPPLD